MDLVGRWTQKGNPVGVWTLDASQDGAMGIMSELRHLGAAPSTQIITNSPFDLQRMWFSA